MGGACPCPATLSRLTLLGPASRLTAYFCETFLLVPDSHYVDILCLTIQLPAHIHMRRKYCYLLFRTEHVSWSRSYAFTGSALVSYTVYHLCTSLRPPFRVIFGRFHLPLQWPFQCSSVLHHSPVPASARSPESRLSVRVRRNT